MIESYGSTSVSDGYVLITGFGFVSLKYGNFDVTPGQFAGWTLIGAEKTADGGYEVAWKTTASNQYTVWNTDSNGNYVSNIGVVSAKSLALESLEPSFQQDLNGDGTTGLVTSVIETFGSTKLVRVEDQYFMYAVGGSTGPAVKVNGLAVTLAQMGPWTAIGAAQTASGYEVAWKLAGADTYTVWNTDSSGNYLSNVGLVPGNSAVLKALEADFQQDLNGDGAIGLTTTPIESFGSTKLVQGDNNYFLFPVAGSSGPALRMSGVPVVAGQTFGWTPIGAEQTASGYEVAWKLAGADPQYTVWYTDSGGNYLSSPIGVVAGNSALLKALEPSFQQDLNGDGVTGLTTTTVLDALGSTKLVQGDSNYFLFPVAGSSGPPLRFGGAAITAGQFGAWTPIGAEQTASGYEIAWKATGADQYTVWYTDSGGNYLSSPIGAVAGNSALLKALEPSFQQDLNLDGVIGLTTTTVLEALGSTKLVQGDNNYFLFPVAGSSGPPLRFGGTAVTAGQFGAWTPIGAEQTASGYEIAWRFGGVDQYTVWFTDGAGNYLSSPFGGVSGSSSALQLLEPSFQQDLNVDGVTGLLIEVSGSTRLTQVGNNYSWIRSPEGQAPRSR